MWTMMWSTVVNSVFAFITTSSTSTRGLATMVLISAFIISMAMSRFTSLIVVISVFINVASTMVIFLIYRSAFQVIAIRCFRVIISAALVLPGTAMWSLSSFMTTAAALPSFIIPIFFIPIRTISSLCVSHRPGQKVQASGDNACNATTENTQLAATRSNNLAKALLFNIVGKKLWKRMWSCTWMGHCDEGWRAQWMSMGHGADRLGLESQLCYKEMR